MTETEYQELCRRSGSITEASATHISKPKRAIRPVPVSGPLSVLLTLHGHCPSKKNLWQRGASGKMFLDSSVKRQIDDLTMQAMFHWRDSGPVEHPDLTVRFFVHHARRDRDGMFTTLLDCLQAAGVLVNDNLANNNGRTILEPAEFVSGADEHVEILIEKK